MKLSFAAGFVLSLLGAPASWASRSTARSTGHRRNDEEKNKVEICHKRGGTAEHVKKSIAESAIESHFKKHGDARPLGPVPGMARHAFDENCAPRKMPCRIGSHGPPIASQCECLWEGLGFSELKDFLTNSENFGPNGTVGAIFDILPSTADASGGYLDGVDIFFSGHAIDDQLTLAQEEAILAFVQNGGAAVITTQCAVSDDLATPFGATGFDPSTTAVPIWCLVTNATHPVVNGPFGEVFPQFLAGCLLGGCIEFTCGTLVGDCRGFGGLPFLIAIEPNELGEGSGPVFLAASPYVFDSHALTNVELNRHLSGNLFAWLAAEVC